MTDSGLSTRLRQQSRRAGLMVGITMVLAIAILIFGAAGLFAWLSRPFSDLIPMVAPAAELAAPSNTNEAPALTPEPQAAEAVPEQNSVEAAVPTIAASTSSENFAPTHQIGALSSVNLRPQPSSDNTADNTPILALSPDTPLQYLDEDAPASNPNDAPRWMRFRTENGEQGWVREVDIEAYQA